MLTVLLADGVEMVRIGLGLAVKQCCPDALLIHARTAGETLEHLRAFECGLLICNEAWAKEDGWAIIRTAALQPGIKIVVRHPGNFKGFGEPGCPYGLLDGTIDLRATFDETSALLASVLEGEMKRRTG